MYSAHYASAESYDAFEAEAQYAQSSRSPAGQPAFHNCSFNQEYSSYTDSQHPVQSGKRAALQCGVNLSDYSDFSDSDSESEPRTPAATVLIEKVLAKTLSEGTIAVDDSTSTDA